MKKLFLIIVVTSLLFSSVNAQKPRFRGDLEQRKIDLVNLLKLTDEQAKKIKDLRLDIEKKNIDLRSEIQKNRIDLRKLMSEKELDAKKILELTNKNSELQAKIKENHVKNLIEINKLLTDEQKEIFIKHRLNMRNAMDENPCRMRRKRI